MVNTDVGDRIVIFNPWMIRLLFVVVFFMGIFIGMIITSMLVFHGINVIGDSFRVENINMTIVVNESQIIEAINRTRTP